MANTKLGNLAEGSVVKIREDGQLEEFYVAEHNYQSRLNGTGRTLLLRKNSTGSRKWEGNGDGYTAKYILSKLRTWLNSDYKAVFDADIKKAMDTTKFRYTISGTSVGTMEDSVFLLAATELGGNREGMNNEGTEIPIISILLEAKMSGWTRSPKAEEDGSGGYVWCLYSGGGFITGGGSGSDQRGVFPAFTLPAGLYITDSGEITQNSAPSVPPSIAVPEDVSGGTTITISWAASTDAEDNLEGYIVQRSTDGGSSWTQIYQGSALTTTNSVAFGTASVMYRVKAYDSEGLESDWRTSVQRTVLNNRAPSAPPSITVPNSAKGGGVLTVSWTKAADSDGNLSGYELERSVGGGAWSRVYRGTALTYTDSITKGWSTVAYRVRAYDTNSAYSGYTTSPARTVNNNTAPVITSPAASGTNLGTKAEGFSLSYQVTDADSDAVTVTEFLDGVSQRSYRPVLGAQNTFRAVTSANFQKVLNGAHTLRVTASDGKESAAWSAAFTKAVHAASVTLTAPMEADAPITACALSVTGSIPADAEYSVAVTNNGLDDAPVWEDCTAAVRNGANHIFANQAAANGFAFNFRVSVKRGAGGQGGYITSIQGGFQ